jgi:hypothetical protein
MKIVGLSLRGGDGNAWHAGSLDRNGVVLIPQDAFDISGSIGRLLIQP